MINYGDDGGAYLSDALTILKNYGALKISDLPYDTNYTWVPGNTNISSEEMIPERIEALQTRIKSFSSWELPNNGTFIYGPDDPDLDIIKELLNDGKVLTITTKSNFNCKYGVDRNNSTIKIGYRCYGGGGHAMAVVGYDDNAWCDVNNNGIVENCEKGAFKIADSYGEDGANYDTNGYFWLLYDSINKISANTINTWESNLSGTRVQALRNETIYPTFWFINVEKYDVNLIGEVDINTGNRKLSQSQFLIGRAENNSVPTYNSSPMLPEGMGAGKYNGKIFFDYGSLCSPITSYLTGYKWYVKFSSLYGTYNFKVIDNMNNLLQDYGSNNSTVEKYVNISTMLGDVDYSGGLSTNDSTMIQNYVLQLCDFSNLQKNIADCNQDGIINLADAIYVRQQL